MQATVQGADRTAATDHRPAEKLYPVAEVAEMWRCSVQHVYNLISKGELRSLDLAVGRSQRAKTRVPESALAEFTAHRSRKAG